MLSVENLTCSYGKIKILNNISFNVEENQILCILGANGSGKTTLLKSIFQIVESEGTVKLFGENLKTKKRNELSKQIAMISQITNILFSYTVYETVLMGRYAHKLKETFVQYDQNDKDIVLDSLQKTGVYNLKDKLITELSGGQLQRVFLARIFAQSPSVILLDEPTNHLDIKYQIELMQNIKEWVKNKNKCVVGVLHDINLALLFSDRILLIDKGETVTNCETKKFDLNLISKIYGVNVKEYMKKSFEIWK